MQLTFTASLKKALHQLEVEKQNVDAQIAAVRAALKTLGSKGAQRLATTRAKRKRYRMTAAARRAVSKRMKAYWAKRRAAANKAKGMKAGKSE